MISPVVCEPFISELECNNVLSIHTGTSSRSTKLLHGGIRYLEKAAKTLDYGEFKLVTEVQLVLSLRVGIPKLPIQHTSTTNTKMHIKSP